MLFADVKGSVDLAEQLDPVERHAILDRFIGDALAAPRELAEARRLYAEMGATAQVERLAKEIVP